MILKYFIYWKYRHCQQDFDTLNVCLKSNFFFLYCYETQSFEYTDITLKYRLKTILNLLSL